MREAPRALEAEQAGFGHMAVEGGVGAQGDFLAAQFPGGLEGLHIAGADWPRGSRSWKCSSLTAPGPNARNRTLRSFGGGEVVQPGAAGVGALHAAGGAAQRQGAPVEVRVLGRSGLERPLERPLLTVQPLQVRAEPGHVEDRQQAGGAGGGGGITTVLRFSRITGGSTHHARYGSYGLVTAWPGSVTGAGAGALPTGGRRAGADTSGWASGPSIIRTVNAPLTAAGALQQHPAPRPRPPSRPPPPRLGTTSTSAGPFSIHSMAVLVRAPDQGGRHRSAFAVHKTTGSPEAPTRPAWRS